MNDSAVPRFCVVCGGDLRPPQGYNGIYSTVIANNGEQHYQCWIASGVTASDAQVEAATRAFLRRIKPSQANAPVANLNSIDLDDTDFEIMDAMRDALRAALR